MAAVSVHDVLRPLTLTKVVSRVAASTSTVLNLFDMTPGASNETHYGHGREGSYHIFDHVRTVGTGRAPGTAAGKRKRQRVGKVHFTFPRMHESVELLLEELHNFSRIGDQATRDRNGVDFIRRQMQPVGERVANWRTAMIVGMLRDSLYVHEDGDDWYFTYDSSGSTFQIAHEMPAGNKSQLNMLGAGNIIDVSWDNTSANIPLHLHKINAAMLQLTGGRLDYVMITSIVWNHIMNNDYVAAHHGASAPPFETFERQIGTGPDGTPINALLGRINSVPNVIFWITDEGLELGIPGSETYTKHIEDTAAAFFTDPRRGWAEMITGSEPIAENEMAQPQDVIGMKVWNKTSFNPTAHEIFALDNALCVNTIPNGNAYGTVVF